MKRGCYSFPSEQADIQIFYLLNARFPGYTTEVWDARHKIEEKFSVLVDDQIPAIIAHQLFECELPRDLADREDTPLDSAATPPSVNDVSKWLRKLLDEERRLSSMSSTSLNALFMNSLARSRSPALKDEVELIASYEIDTNFRAMARFTNWSFEEAEQFLGEALSLNQSEITEILKRAMTRSENTSAITPQIVIESAKETTSSMPDWLSEALTNRREPSDEVDPRHINSLYKIIIGITVEKFHHITGKSYQPTAGNVHDCLERNGIRLSKKSIQQILEAAAEKVLAERPPK